MAERVIDDELYAPDRRGPRPWRGEPQWTCRASPDIHSQVKSARWGKTKVCGPQIAGAWAWLRGQVPPALVPTAALGQRSRSRAVMGPPTPYGVGGCGWPRHLRWWFHPYVVTSALDSVQAAQWASATWGICHAQSRCPCQWAPPSSQEPRTALNRNGGECAHVQWM